MRYHFAGRSLDLDRLGLPAVMSDALSEELKSAEPDRFPALLAEGSRWSPPEAADVAIRALDDHLAPSPG